MILRHMFSVWSLLYIIVMFSVIVFTIIVRIIILLLFFPHIFSISVAKASRRQWLKCLLQRSWKCLGVADSELHTKLEIRWCSRWPGRVFWRVMYRVAIWWRWALCLPFLRTLSCCSSSHRPIPFRTFRHSIAFEPNNKIIPALSTNIKLTNFINR